MDDTVINWLNNISAPRDQWTLLNVIGPIADRFSSCATSSAGLVIKAGGSTLAKTGSAVTNLNANGVPVAIAAATDMPALTGINVTSAYYRIVCFFIDSASVVTAAAGAEATTLAGCTWPTFPQGKALVGFLTINASGGAFTGGTTALDDGTVTTTYNSPTGAFDPSVIVGANGY